MFLAKQKAIADAPAILLADKNNLSRLCEKQRTSLNGLPPIRREGFHIFKSESNIVIAGKDAFRFLCDFGCLLRKAEIGPGSIY